MVGNQCLDMNRAKFIASPRKNLRRLNPHQRFPRMVRTSRRAESGARGRGDIKGEASKDPTLRCSRCPSFSRNESRAERERKKNLHFPMPCSLSLLDSDASRKFIHPGIPHQEIHLEVSTRLEKRFKRTSKPSTGS